MPAIRVLIVDDSELIRTLLSEVLSSDREFEVVGTAADPYEAREKIKQLEPDVITLDVEMPRMDGITFLRNLMRLRPMPVVMISTLTTKGAETTLQALELGAIDFIPKPRLSVKTELPALAEEITSRVRQAARANVGALDVNRARQAAAPPTPMPKGLPGAQVSLIAIGASTGGTEATKAVLSALPEKMPPIAVVQHMPDGFTASYAKRLNASLPLTVEEFTRSGQPLLPNHVYIANGANHFRVEKKAGQLIGVIDTSEAVNRHKPSVDVLFRSVAEQVGVKSIALLLTGMGVDGARGLGMIRSAGGMTLAQDERSSVVWGMPRAAIEAGAASEVLPLADMGRFLAEYCYR